MRTSIVLAGWLIGFQNTMTYWVVFSIALIISILADIVKTDWKKLKNDARD